MPKTGNLLSDFIALLGAADKGSSAYLKGQAFD